MADTLFDCYLVAKDFVAFELERCAGMNTCTAPPFYPVSLCSTQQGAEKKRDEEQRKESITETSPGLSLRGQGSEVGMEGVCQVLSGADKPTEGLLNAYLETY